MASEPEDQRYKRLDVSEEAADWMLRLQAAPDDPQFKADLENWLASVPENRQAWERVQAMWRALPQVPDFYERISEKGEAHAPGRPQTVGTRQGRGAASGFRRRFAVRQRVFGMVLAAGAAVCLAIMAGPDLLIRFQADYRTVTAASQTVLLEDGSTVVLGGDSAVRARFADGTREVALLAGEAWFDVVLDPARPFIVDTGDVRVEVLGTAFDVRMTDDSTDVGLARGAVRATYVKGTRETTETLSPGELLSIDRETGAMTRDHVAVEDIGAWRDGRLFVVDATIGSVVEHIRRYHPAWITVPDAALARQKVTGIYDLQNPDQALRALVDPYGGKVRAVSPLMRVVSRP